MTGFQGFANKFVSQFGSKFSPIVDELLRWQVTNEYSLTENDPFYEKAVKSLVRKLKRSGQRSTGTVEILIRTIQEQSPESQCICIPRSLDGRMQVSQKKVLPHVLYCTIWRWPDLKNHHELRSIPTCIYSYNLKQQKDEVCINPYHYERIKNAPVPAVLVPRLPVSRIPENLRMFDSIIPRSALDEPMDEEQDWVVAPTMTLENMHSPGGYLSEDIGSESDGTFIAASPQSVTSQATSVIKINTNYTGETVNKIEVENCSSLESPFTPDSHQSDPVGYVDVKVEDETEDESINGSPTMDMEHRTEVSYEELTEWCTIHYYEMNCRYGDPFQGKAPIIRIDGWTDPSNGNRLCLGVINNVSRTQEVELARRNIGSGVELVYEMGKVSIKNLSDASVFIQSPHMNEMWNMDSKTVVKIPSGHEADIFDNQKFATRLAHSVEFGFESVYRLNNMCTLRLSFVKGWGRDYRRAHITATPCWIEIHLNGPLQWLDRVLREMGGPKTAMTSFS